MNKTCGNCRWSDGSITKLDFYCSLSYRRISDKDDACEHWMALSSKKNCENCKWHDDFSWVCSNDESPNVADFTDNEDSCWLWEERDGHIDV